MKDTKKTVKISKYALLLVLAVLTASLVKAALFPDYDIPYENRKANRFEKLTLDSFISESFQDSFETALSDQVPFSSYAKKIYNIIDTRCALPVISALSDRQGGYIRFRDIYFYKDMLVSRPYTFESTRQCFEDGAEKIRSYKSLCPDTDLYVYYITTDKDVHFVSGDNTASFELLKDESGLENRMRNLKIRSFDDYHRYFLKTDHHWNHEGAAKAYNDICSMMQIEPMQPTGEFIREKCYLGTRAAGVEGVQKEDFGIMLYDYPEMTVTVTGFPEYDDYGNQEKFRDGLLDRISYGDVFGTDFGEIIFDTGRPGENIVVIGDSYDNEIIRAIASGFSKTYSIDLRAFEVDTGSKFDYKSYIEDNGIDRVLIICNLEAVSNYHI